MKSQIMISHKIQGRIQYGFFYCELIFSTRLPCRICNFEFIKFLCQIRHFISDYKNIFSLEDDQISCRILGVIDLFLKCSVSYAFKSF